MANDTKNIFISHIHEDDEGLAKLKDLIKSNGMTPRDLLEPRRLIAIRQRCGASSLQPMRGVRSRACTTPELRRASSLRVENV